MAPRCRVAVLLVLLVGAGCSGSSSEPSPSPSPQSARCGEAEASLPVSLGRSWAPEPSKAGGLSGFARVKGSRLVVSLEGGPVDFVPGVNLGATLPGTFPAELAPAAEDYRRWFPQMASLGLRALRVYTILPPHFYEELRSYNEAHPDAPLLLVQGVWAPEEKVEGDAFHTEIRDAVGALSGSVELPVRRGHAGGRFSADVTPWLLAMSLGIEWDPLAVQARDQEHAGEPVFSGEWVTAGADATSMESWLAEALDVAAGALAEQGVTVPLTFTNWVTTDPLRHPDEPLENEDLVGIDAEHMRATEAWPAGLFASYHVYPYYPDFMPLAEGDGWRAELEALLAHHAGPVMVTEFGVPSSTGIAHRGAEGRDQGQHSEEEAMAIDAEMLCTVASLDFAGAFLFEWADEWFKFTWNTLELERPGERRQLWMNPLTNEEHFGLLAMDPAGGVPPRVLFESRDAVREITAGHDEGYLHLRLTLDEPWDETGVEVSFGDHSVEVSADGVAQAFAGFEPFELPISLDPPESVNVGKLERGESWTADGNVVELHVPWMMAGLSDPSNPTGPLPVEVTAGSETARAEYHWEPWQRVEWDERLKAGVEVYAGAVERTLRP